MRKTIKREMENVREMSIAREKEPALRMDSVLEMINVQ